MIGFLGGDPANACGGLSKEQGTLDSETEDPVRNASKERGRGLNGRKPPVHEELDDEEHEEDNPADEDDNEVEEDDEKNADDEEDEVDEADGQAADSRLTGLCLCGEDGGEVWRGVGMNEDLDALWIFADCSGLTDVRLIRDILEFNGGL